MTTAADDLATLVLWLITVAVIVGLVCCGRLLRAAEPCVTLTVAPRIMLRRGPIALQLHIPRHADHRAYLIQWSSDTGSEGSSGHSLEGTPDQTIYMLALPDQPVGHYVFLATVADAAGRILGSARAEIQTPEGIG